MKLFKISNKDVIKFDTEEEIELFSRFIFENDYFVRKNFKTFADYLDYIFKNSGNNLYIDTDYHYHLAVELTKNYEHYQRREKLIKIMKSN